MEALCKSGSLFEVTVPDHRQLKACHKEVRQLKELWDMITMVRGAPSLRGRDWGGLHGQHPSTKRGRSRYPSVTAAFDG